MGEVVSFDGVRRRVAEQGTTPRNVNKQTRSSHFYGNRWTGLQLSSAVLTSHNWGQAARKLGGYRIAWEALTREFERKQAA